MGMRSLRVYVEMNATENSTDGRRRATTTVRVAPDTRDDLYELKAREDTYDDVIRRLLDEHAAGDE